MDSPANSAYHIYTGHKSWASPAYLIQLMSSLVAYSRSSAVHVSNWRNRRFIKEIITDLRASLHMIMDSIKNSSFLASDYAVVPENKAIAGSVLDRIRQLILKKNLKVQLTWVIQIVPGLSKYKYIFDMKDYASSENPEAMAYLEHKFILDTNNPDHQSFHIASIEKHAAELYKSSSSHELLKESSLKAYLNAYRCDQIDFNHASRDDVRIFKCAEAEMVEYDHFRPLPIIRKVGDQYILLGVIYFVYDGPMSKDITEVYDQIWRKLPELVPAAGGPVKQS